MDSEITLFLRPELDPFTGEEFKRMAGAYSIALDGFVKEGPWYDPRLPSRNFNHHEDVSRLDTRCTAAQVLMSIRQGLFERFQQDGLPRADVWANDCDEDVCLSWFLLDHHYMVRSPVSPAINRIVHMVDMMDSTAGAYPFPNFPGLQELAWIMQPYRVFRRIGGLEHREVSVFRSVVDDVSTRIMETMVGRGKSISLDTRWESLRAGRGWSLVKEDGDQARIGLFADGVKAFVSVTERKDGRWSYVVGRMGEYIDFDVPRILAALNQEDDHLWGGGNTIGGSSRSHGSSLNPDRVFEIVESVR